MCGRFVRVASVAEIVDSFDIVENDIERELRPSYNVAPSHMIPVVLQSQPRSLSEAVWGFKAPWKGAGALVINARVETVFEKQSFRSQTAAHRCVIPMSGYFEWLTNVATKSSLGVGRTKIPFFINAADDSPLKHRNLLAAAGLLRTDGEGSRCVMLTTAANESVSSIHDRMPVLLDARGLTEWLSERATPSMFDVLGGSTYPLDSMRASTRANSVSNNDPSVLEPDPPTTLF
jgi:putative SOS response-associated peptidase YedK